MRLRTLSGHVPVSSLLGNEDLRCLHSAAQTRLRRSRSPPRRRTPATMDPRASSPAGISHSNSSFNSGPATSSGLSVRVDEERRECSADGWEYSSYVIVTSYQGQTFQAHRRFREFRHLHAQLVVHIPALPHNFPLWGHLLNRYAPEVIEARKLGFQRYLTDVLAALKGAAIPQPLRAFLQLPLPEEVDTQQAQTLIIPSQLERSDHVILVAYQLPLLVERAGGAARLAMHTASLSSAPPPRPRSRLPRNPASSMRSARAAPCAGGRRGRPPPRLRGVSAEEGCTRRDVPGATHSGTTRPQRRIFLVPAPNLPGARRVQRAAALKSSGTTTRCSTAGHSTCPSMCAGWAVSR